MGNFRGAIFDGLLRQVQIFSSSNLWRTVLELFRVAIFDGLLRELPNFLFEQSLTHIGWEIFVERSSMDFVANFQILLRIIFDAYRLGNFRGAISDGLLRQLPNSSSYNLRRIWEIFVERSSTDFFANSKFLIRIIFDAYRFGNFSCRDLRWTSSPTSKFFVV